MDDRKHTPIDPCKLEIQLLKAIEEDSKYKIEDAAKFRAAEQSKNYEEFRDIVKAAHLRPLEKFDSLQHSKTRFVSWNKTAKRGCWRSKTDKNLAAAMNNFDSTTEDVLNASITQRTFEQCWLSSNNIEKRVTLLQQVIAIDNFFKGKDLSIDIIESLIKALLECMDSKTTSLPSEEKVDFVIKAMISISSTSRFSLNLQLFSNEGQDNIRNLLNKVTELQDITDSVTSRQIVRDLAIKYNCQEINC